MRPASFCFRRSRARSSAGRAVCLIAGSRMSQTRFITACMSRVPLVMATTASCSGITIAVLAEGAVAAVEAVAAAPELIAVALVPVALRVAAVRGLARGGRRHPLGGQELPALPRAALQVELAEAGDVLGRRVEPEAPERDSLWARVPLRVADAERLEQPRPQVLDERLAGHLLDDGGQHVGRRRVVEEVRPGLVGDRQREERADERHGRLVEGEPGEVVRVVPGRHRQQVPHAHRLQVVARLRRSILGEEGQHLSSRLSFPSAIASPDPGRGEALAEREQHVRVVALVRPPPALGHDRGRGAPASGCAGQRPSRWPPRRRPGPRTRGSLAPRESCAASPGAFPRRPRRPRHSRAGARRLPSSWGGILSRASGPRACRSASARQPRLSRGGRA